MKLYIAGPLFNEMERSRNEEVTAMIESLGVVTYLPQRDGGVFSQMVESGMNASDARKHIFKLDVEAIRASDVILCLLDGRVPDEGLCVELGMAHGLGKKRVGYLTDSRTFNKEGMNLMITESLEKVFTNKKDLLNFFLTSNV